MPVKTGIGKLVVTLGVLRTIFYSGGKKQVQTSIYAEVEESKENAT